MSDSIEDAKALKVFIPCEDKKLRGELAIPLHSKSIVIFIQSQEGCKDSLRNQILARTVRECRIATLLVDIFTADEALDEHIDALAIDFDRMGQRLMEIVNWTLTLTPQFKVGVFASDTFACAALIAATKLGSDIDALVCAESSIDIAADYLPMITASTLLVVSEQKAPLIEINRKAYAMLECEKEMTVIPRSEQSFDQYNVIDKLACVTGSWFFRHFNPQHTGPGVSTR